MPSPKRASAWLEFSSRVSSGVRPSAYSPLKRVMPATASGELKMASVPSSFSSSPP